MRLIAAILSLATTLIAAPPAVEKPFPQGGRILLELEAGGYRIVPSPDDKIRVTCQGNRADEARVHVSSTGNQAEVSISRTPRNNFKAVIELPQRADLEIKLSAGELKVGAFEGHKEITLRAGEVNLQVGDPDAYRHVRASVLAGEICADPWGKSKGGLFRGFDLEGPGKYDLKVKLLAGEITLKR